MVSLQLACNRAAAHMKTGAYGDALADCDAALQMDPEYTKVRARREDAGACVVTRSKAISRRAECLRMLERFDEAAGLHHWQCCHR